MTVKINSLQIENVKRVKAVMLEPTANGLTVIGGKNNQGKTSVLDSIAWALGGDRYRPSDPGREGSATDPHLKIVLSNGLVVERKGKNSDLKVIDPEGGKSGQQLLDSFVEKLAIDLPRFLMATDKEKAQTLLGIIGVGDKLTVLEQQEDTLANQRLTIGQLARQKRGAADEMPVYAEAPAEPVSVAELVQKQQALLSKNGENQRIRNRAEQLLSEAAQADDDVVAAQKVLEAAQRKRADVETLLETARKSAQELQDESTAEIEQSIADIETTNEKVRTNQAKATAEAAADELEGQYAELNEQIEKVRTEKVALLEGAKMPLPELSVDHGELVYNGQKWDNMSGSEQLRVSTAIVRELKPECGFVLVDKLEQLDTETLQEFGAWAEAEGLQVIATRVSTGAECSIIIEDGYGSLEEVATPTVTFDPNGGF